MFMKSVFENHHVFSISGIILDHSNHLTFLEYVCHIPLRDQQ